MDDDNPTRRRVLRAGGLVGVLGFSGCLRLTEPSGQQAVGTPPSTDTATATETPTATATDTPGEAVEADPNTETETAEQDGVSYPPGVSEDGVTATLVLSHRQAVADTPRTVETKYMLERRTARLTDGRAYVESDRGPDTYIADSQTYQRLRTADGPIYGYRNGIRREFRREALSGVGVLEALIEGMNFRPVGTQTRNGETFILIEADSVTDQRILQENDNVSRYFRESEFPLQGDSGTGIVSQDGVITELSAFLEGDGDSGEFLVRTTEIGSTTVPEPSWTSTAKQEEAQFEASLVDDGNYIRAEQVSGQSLDTELEIDAYDRRDYYDGQFSGSTSPGTVFFLYKTDDQTEYGSQKLGISKGGRPSESPAGTWSSDTGWNLHARDLRVVNARDVA